MIRYLLDTDTVSALVRDPFGPAAEKAWRQADAVGTSIVVVGELQFGLIKRGSSRLAMLVNETLRSLPTLALEHPTEVRYAEIRSFLSDSGALIGPNDLWIAAHALALDCTLVTGNKREFRRVPGLRLENWLTPADT